MLIIPYRTVPYQTVLCGKNTRILSISTEKFGNTRSTPAFVCLVCVQDKTKQKALLRVPAGEMQTLTTVPVCRGNGLTNSSAVTHVLKELPSSFPHRHKEWAIFNTDHLKLVFSTAAQRLQTYARREHPGGEVNLIYAPGNHKSLLVTVGFQFYSGTQGLNCILKHMDFDSLLKNFLGKTKKKLLRWAWW